MWTLIFITQRRLIQLWPSPHQNSNVLLRLLAKRALRVAVYIRYAWAILDLPERCVCGGWRFSHAAAQRSQRFVSTLNEAKFFGVGTERDLMELSGESFKLKSANVDEEARSDVKCIGFWRRLRQAYFDIRVIIHGTSSKFLLLTQKRPWRQLEPFLFPPC